MAHPEADSASSSGAVAERRGFLSVATWLMASGLTAGYGMFAFILGRFAYPARIADRSWLFVCTVERLSPDEALDIVTPSGLKVVVARQGEGTTADDFLALSSVCPHLGCRVHWEAQNDRFFCPCHNGAFDRSGVATTGPPAAARQSLVRYPLKVSDGLLFLEAPLARLGGEQVAGAATPCQRSGDGDSPSTKQGVG